MLSKTLMTLAGATAVTSMVIEPAPTPMTVTAKLAEAGVAPGSALAYTSIEGAGCLAARSQECLPTAVPCLQGQKAPCMHLTTHDCEVPIAWPVPCKHRMTASDEAMLAMTAMTIAPTITTAPTAPTAAKVPRTEFDITLSQEWSFHYHPAPEEPTHGTMAQAAIQKVAAKPKHYSDFKLNIPNEFREWMRKDSKAAEKLADDFSGHGRPPNWYRNLPKGQKDMFGTVPKPAKKTKSKSPDFGKRNGASSLQIGGTLSLVIGAIGLMAML